MVIPSLTDPSVAPPGKHVLSCFVQYAPYKLAKGTWDDQRDAFGDTVVNTIAEHAPNIKKIIIDRQVLTPLDLEREFGLTQGNIFQGELSLEQLFFLRPVPGWAYYRTPIDNLYMCGSATHPGGGIMGAPGRIASQVILKDWQKIAAARRPAKSNAASRTMGPKSDEPTEAQPAPLPEPAIDSSSPSSHSEKN
jgi:phytoene dehydrogenase-like protein